MTRYSPTTLQAPVGLADVLNPTQSQEQRDSAYFSCSSVGDASKHASIASTNNPHLFTPPSSGYSSVADKTPSPIAANHAPPLASPTSTGMTVASMVTPVSPLSPDATMLAKLDRPSYDSSQRASGISINSDSRRESVESRINHGFEGMKLASNSPYASNNQSTTSIHSSLQQQRNPTNGPDRLSAARFPGSYHPTVARFGSDGQKQSRTAPTITGPATSAVAHAAEPTKGQPWAFPDEADQRMPPAPRSNAEPISRQTSYLDSRRSSIADSLASSQYTTESRLPQGQRRLEDGYPNDYNRLSRASSEFQGASHHHHSLQHKQIGDLRDEDGGSPGSGQPYSRTPELRISHKLAERKRRNEMKELYDELRDLMPQERGSKASKWEILSKAIAEHKRQDDYIRRLQDHCNRTQAELQASREETAELRQEVRQLRQEVANVVGQAMHPHPAPLGHPNQPPNQLDPYVSDQYARGLPVRTETRSNTELPPIRSIGGAVQPVADTMTGVQYQHDGPNGYRPGHLIRRAAFRSIPSPSTSFFSKSRSINTSSPFTIRTKPQATISPIFRRFTSNDVETEGQSNSASNDSSASESASTNASEAANHFAEDAVVGTASSFAATTGLGRDNRNEYRPRSNYKNDRGSAPPSDLAGRRGSGPSNLRVTPSAGLYIGNLLFEVTDEDLRREFGEFGEIREAYVARDDRNLSKGFGYVIYNSIDAATAAIQARNQTVLEGRRIVVNYQIQNARSPATNTPSKTLFIGNLAFEMSDADLNKLFRDIQNVMDVRVAIDRRTGQPRGFAHADFVDVESAMKGLDYLQGKEFYGRVLRVDYAGETKKAQNVGYSNPRGEY